MNALKSKYGPWALITGASSGIGAEFARHLAAHGLNLVLVARRLPLLQQLAEQMTREHPIEVRTVACDLSKADFLHRLNPQLEHVDIGLLVNNAGFANTGAVVDNTLEQELDLLYVNCRAYLVLAHEFGRRMKIKGRGGMIFVSSTTAYSPPTLWAHYAASKAYELVLGEAMHEEMRQVGVDMLVVCPGPTQTPFYTVSDQDLQKTPRDARFLLTQPSDVVTTALRSLGAKRSVVVGWGNKLVVQSGRFLPKSFSMKKVSKFVASTRREQEDPLRSSA